VEPADHDHDVSEAAGWRLGAGGGVREVGTWTGAALAAVIAASWPAALRLDSHISSDPKFADAQVGLWWPGQVARALIHADNPFLATDLVWPDGQDLTLLVWNLLAQVAVAPLWWFANPAMALNLSGWAIGVMNGVACAWAVRRLDGRDDAALAAAVVGAASHYAWAETGFGRLDQALWAPVAVFLAELAARDLRPVRAGVALGLAGAVYWFYAYFLVIILAGWAAAQRSRTAVGSALQLGVVAGLVAMPFLAPVGWAAWTARDSARAVAGSVGEGWLNMQRAASTRVPGDTFWPLGSHPGMPSCRMPLLLLPTALAALLAGRRTLGAAILFAGLCAAGPMLTGGDTEPVRVLGGVVWMPQLLVDALPGMRRFWWCYRWLGVAIPAFILAASLLAGRWRQGPVLLGGWAVLETILLMRGGWPATESTLYLARPDPVLEAIARVPGPAPVVQVPSEGLLNASVGWQAWFRQPVDGGIVWQIPSARTKAWNKRQSSVPLLAALSGREPAPHAAGEAWTSAEAGGFHYVALYGGTPSPRDEARLDALLRAMIGSPFATDQRMSWWAVPGVGVVPE
jgi:hypothetical protein